jgi:hypothetical protein
MNAIGRRITRLAKEEVGRYVPQEPIAPGEAETSERDRGASVWDDEAHHESRVFSAKGSGHGEDKDETGGISLQCEAGDQYPRG